MDSMGMDMGGGGGADGGPPACKISMLWNWYTIDACFLARSWHIRSRGAFAASCIAVVLLVMSLEALRRLAKEYDAYIVRRRLQAIAAAAAVDDAQDHYDGASSSAGGHAGEDSSIIKNLSATTAYGAIPSSPAAAAQRSFTPTLAEQLVRAGLHVAQFAVAYAVMLLAMYYNGYIIICILIGAYLGAFVFGWESVKLPLPGAQEREREITYCCG